MAGSNDVMRVACSAAFVTVLVLSSRTAAACECLGGGPPCQNYFQVDAVFVGTVRAISTIGGTPDATFQRHSVTFTIERAFRGVEGMTVDVATGVGGGDCGYEFKAGERYLVYAYKNGRTGLSTSICSRTRPMSAAGDDLSFIERMPPLGTGGRVYGVITHRERDLVHGGTRKYDQVPPIHLLLRGKSGGFDAQSDEHGRYEITGVAPGAYELQIIPPANFGQTYLQPGTIVLRDARACAEADVEVRYDGRISGFVQDGNGYPAQGIDVELIASDMVIAPGAEMLKAKSSPTGFYEFTDVPPGEYMVGVSLRHTREPDVLYPRTFHPGAPVWPDATVVTIGEGDHRQLEPFRLPAPRQRRELTGVVIWPDARPAAGAFVSLIDGDHGFHLAGAGMRVDVDGRFGFVVHDGLSYTVRASFNIADDPQRRQLEASAGPFVVSSQTAPITLRLIAPRDR